MYFLGVFSSALAETPGRAPLSTPTFRAPLATRGHIWALATVWNGSFRLETRGTARRLRVAPGRGRAPQLSVKRPRGERG